MNITFQKKNVSSKKKAYREWADELRIEAAQKLRLEFLRNFDKQKALQFVSKSFLSEHLDTFPSPNSLQIIAFNLFLARSLVEELCSTLSDPLDVAYLASRIGEASYRSFIDPEDPTKRIEYLAPSKSMGYFFTPPEIALLMAEKLLADDTTTELDILDPSAGYGSLLVATLIKAKEKKVKIRSLTGFEIDKFTCENLEKILARVIELLGLKVQWSVRNEDAIETLSNGLNRLTSNNQRYHRVIMNPPYGRVKFLKNFLTNKETKSSDTVLSLEEQERRLKEKTTSMMERLDALSKDLGFDSSLREYSKLFLTLALANLEQGGRMSIISPSGWLGDKESHEVRRLIVNNNYLEEIFIFREDGALFETVNQHTAVSIFSKTPKEKFDIVVGYTSLASSGERTRVDYTQLRTLDPLLLKIPRHGREDHEIYLQLKKHPNIGDVADIKNLRGEIDLSLNKDMVTSEDTGLRLIRGDHVERYVVHPAEKSKRDGYVNPDKLYSRITSHPKFSDIGKHRIVGRQCSYLDKKRRLDFALLNPNNVVGNSCNYLYLTSQSNDKEPDKSLITLLGLLNSAVMEWYFRLYSSNNHVANYEIADFPVCLDNEHYVTLIAQSTQFLISAYKNTKQGVAVSSIEDFHDALVGLAYGLTPKMIGRVLLVVDPSRQSRVVNFAEKIEKGLPINDFNKSENWFNHYISTLSELDEQIIKYVPQGGNWQNIPDHVPSQRLKQIREMSAERGVVRTTYYGRLKPEQPSYTIATYYNRPGNGTNIHPWEDRTLSSREAARLQSFPDSYLFFGSEGGIRTQIGNAVPPLLAYSVGRYLGDRYGFSTCVDAFAGAGGLSLGLELAGWDVIAANDNDKHAAITYRMNRLSHDGETDEAGRTAFIEGDITDPKIADLFLSTVVQKLKGKKLGLLVGGPPCQGFSHAGFRRKDDIRNDLASRYLELASVLQPETFLLENVEGLLTYNSGQVVQDIIRALKEMGYKIEEPWVMNAEQYGVPQMRRRVLLVANKKELVPKFPALFRKCPGRRASQPTIDTHLAEPVTVAEALVDLPPLKKRRFTKGLDGVNHLYSQWLRGTTNTSEFLTQRSFLAKGTAVLPPK